MYSSDLTRNLGQISIRLLHSPQRIRKLAKYDRYRDFFQTFPITRARAIFGRNFYLLRSYKYPLFRAEYRERVGKRWDCKRIGNGQQTDRRRMIILFLSGSYPFAIPSVFYSFSNSLLSFSSPFATQSFFYPFSNRLLSVSSPTANPSFFYPFPILFCFQLSNLVKKNS